MVNTKIRLIIFFAAKGREVEKQLAKARPGADCGSDHEHLTVKFRLKLKTVGKITISFSSVQFSRSAVSNSLRPRKLQHARPPCPSLTPGVYPNLGPSSRICHPTISSSVIPPSHPLSSPSTPALNLYQHQGLFK